jgi:hypothetical protein
LRLPTSGHKEKLTMIEKTVLIITWMLWMTSGVFAQKLLNNTDFSPVQNTLLPPKAAHENACMQNCAGINEETGKSEPTLPWKAEHIGFDMIAGEAISTPTIGNYGRCWAAFNGDVLVDHSGPDMGQFNLPINRVMLNNRALTIGEINYLFMKTRSEN